MDVTKTMELDLKDVYQFLISDLRYGYRRNNHLMPGCAYTRTKELIDRMYEIDYEYAIYTLRQICEECITDQLTWNFFDGYDDEMGNRREAIEFVNWCMEWIHSHGDPNYKPYCWDRFEYNLAKDDEPRYRVYELIGDEKKLLTPEPVSYKKYPDYIFTKENLDKKNSATYHHIVMRGEIGSSNYLPYHLAPVKYEFIAPTQRVYLVEHI